MVLRGMRKSGHAGHSLSSSSNLPLMGRIGCCDVNCSRSLRTQKCLAANRCSEGSG